MPQSQRSCGSPSMRTEQWTETRWRFTTERATSSKCGWRRRWCGEFTGVWVGRQEPSQHAHHRQDAATRCNGEGPLPANTPHPLRSPVREYQPDHDPKRHGLAILEVLEVRKICQGRSYCQKSPRRHLVAGETDCPVGLQERRAFGVRKSSQRSVYANDREIRLTGSPRTQLIRKHF